MSYELLFALERAAADCEVGRQENRVVVGCTGVGGLFLCRRLGLGVRRAWLLFIARLAIGSVGRVAYHRGVVSRRIVGRFVDPKKIVQGFVTSLVVRYDL